MRYSSYLVKKDLLDKDIQGLSTEDMDNLREKWLRGGNSATHSQFEWFRLSLAHAFETIIRIGFRPKIMKKMHIFAFLGQFYYYNPDVELNEDHRNEVFRFLAQCLLLNESYRVLTIGNARSWMRYLHDRQGEYDEFPGSELLAHENLNPSREDIRLVVENASYSGEPGQQVFTNLNVASILGLLDEAYTIRSTNDIGDYDVDHIFPQSKAEEVEHAVGHEVNLDRIGNLQLLFHSLNSEEKRDMWPEEWFDTGAISDTEVEEIKRINQYPDVSLEPASAAEFIEAREELFIDHLEDEYVK